MTNNASNLDGSKLAPALLEIKNSHKCVESIEEIPKLKFIQQKSESTCKSEATSLVEALHRGDWP